MFNILDFIDSKDIREHNLNTQFTPMEQAVLVYHSCLTTVAEKISVWRELLDTYGEDDFKMLSYGERQFAKQSNRRLVADTMRMYEDGLESSDTDITLEKAYIMVPLPFKTGDILKTIDSACETTYAVLPREPVYNEVYKEVGDASDMALSLDTYDDKEDEFDYGHYSLLDLEKCQWSELPGGQKMLILLSQVYQGKMEVGDMLFWYSHYGRGAYGEVQRYLRENGSERN